MATENATTCAHQKTKMMEYKNMVKRGLALCGLLSLLSCGGHKPQFVGKPLLKHDSVQQTGYDTTKLSALSQFIKDSSRTTGMVVLYDGKVLFEYGDVSQVSYLASCRKSILSMLYGKHITNGTIDLNETIGNLGIEEDDGLLPIEKQATVDHIITARSGVFHLPANGGYDTRNVKTRGSVKPGSYFLYNNWDFNVGGAILEQYTGQSVYKELQEQLAIPLGFEDWNLKNQKKKWNKRKSRYAAYHIYVSPRDLAKMGQLMLNKGKWNDEQLIPKSWVDQSTSMVTPVDTVNARNGWTHNDMPQLSYGYMWWLLESFKDNADYEGAFSATGWGGQFLTVIPKRKLVIAHMTKMDKLSLWGFHYKGVSDLTYWKIVDRLMQSQTTK
ncbi:serine hydrolase domain-containing protein [Sediminicola luteus]|uniref:Beta-lactamase-related domain-containing protein n=1 Tax=Sediminicola luteus TaxID=319238 RepID=A0A2A4GFW3_9FLAO|nr:serine hydrolase [Sediminicola luteus]PCE66665.1 hypothetical protein B7P33_05055 [Sediminicola luteus]